MQNMFDKLTQILRVAFKTVQFIAAVLFAAFIIAEIFNVDVEEDSGGFLFIIVALTVLYSILLIRYEEKIKQSQLRENGICPVCAGNGWEGGSSTQKKCEHCSGTGVFIRPYLDIHPSHLDRPYKENPALEKTSLDYRHVPKRGV